MTSSKPFFSTIIDFFASVQLAIFVLFTLAVAAVGGSIIPQNLPPEQYIQGYGVHLYSFLARLDLLDMYNSWWFRALNGLLIVNLVVCSLKRFPITLRLMEHINPDRLKPEFLRKQSLNRTVVLPGNAGPGLKTLRDIFHNRFGAAPKEKQADWGTVLYGERGAFSRFGVYIVHISLLFIAAGAIIGGIYGFAAFMEVSEGQTSNEAVSRQGHEHIQLPFDVRLDDFTVNFYPNGMPSEFRSQVTVKEAGRADEQAEIVVNHPFTRHGVTFYQHSYGQNFSGPSTLKVTRLKDGQEFEIKARQGVPTALPGGGSLVVLDFAPNLMNAGPAVRVLFRPQGQSEYTEWAFEKRPDFLPKPVGGYTALLAGFKLTYWSGFQVNYDPGVPLVWIGCGLMFIGFIVTYFFSHQKLYAAILPGKNKTEIIIAGTSHRNKGSYQIKFDMLAEDIGRLVEKDG